MSNIGQNYWYCMPSYHTAYYEDVKHLVWSIKELPVIGDQTDYKPLTPSLWVQWSSQFSTCLIVYLTNYYLSSLATRILGNAVSPLLMSRVLNLLFTFLTSLMISNSIISWLCSQGYHRPSYSSLGPLYSWAGDRADHILWFAGSVHKSKKYSLKTFPDLFDCLCHITLIFKKMLAGESNSQETVFSVMKLLSVVWRGLHIIHFLDQAVCSNARWDAFILAPPLILTSLLLLPKQNWLFEFKSLFGVEYKFFTESQNF